jgi:hypothetical protein
MASEPLSQAEQIAYWCLEKGDVLFANNLLNHDPGLEYRGGTSILA